MGIALPGKVSIKIEPNLLSEMGNKCDRIIIVTEQMGKQQLIIF